MYVMSLEAWKSFLEWGGIVLLAATVFFGAGALLVNSRLSALQAEKLRQFDKDLTDAKTDLGKQQERAAKAEAQIASADAASKDAVAKVAIAEARVAEASVKAESFRLDIAKANESAQQAEARAAEANLELARFKAPRTLSPAQQAKIATRLRAFAPQTVDIIIIGDSPEITN